MKNNPNATTGTCTATVDSHPEFKSYVATFLSFVPMNTSPEWSVVTSSGNTGRYQLVGFRIPNEGDVNNKRYLLGPGSEASVQYQSVVPGAQWPYTQVSGELIVSVDTQNRKLSATFHLTAQHGTSTVYLTQGKLDVKGYDDEPKAPGIGSVKASITGSVNANYSSTAVELSNEAATPTFARCFRAWSEYLPGRPLPDFLVNNIKIADTLKPGTYTIAKDSKEVNVFFLDRNTGLSYEGISGSITINALPTPGTTDGPLEGTFNCTGSTPDNSASINVTNGSFSVRT